MKTLIIANNKLIGIKPEMGNFIQTKSVKLTEGTFNLKGSIRDIDFLASSSNFQDTLSAIFIKKTPEVASLDYSLLLKMIIGLGIISMGFILIAYILMLI
jgi:hypothetical protein